MDDARADLFGAELFEGGHDRLHGTLHVALDDEREFLAARRLELGHHVRKRTARRTAAHGGLFALLPLAIFGDFTGAGLALDDRDAIACVRRAGEAEHFHREGRRRRGHVSALVIEQGAHAAPLGARHDDIAHRQGAALHQNGGHGATTTIQPGLDDGAFGGTVGVGVQIEQFGLQGDGLEQLVEIELLERGHFDLERVAAQGFHLHFVLQQLAAHALWLGVGLVDLVDRHDQRHASRLRMADRLDGLGHDAVVSRHHEHDDIRHLGAAGAHGGEGGVAGGVDEGHGNAAGGGDLIGADMLGDAAGLAGHHIGVTDRVEQRCLAVIDMAHDGDDGGTGNQMLVGVGLVEKTLFNVRFRYALDRMAHLLGDELRRIGVDHVGDLAHLALAHEQLDHVHGALRHAVGELLDGDGLGQDDLAQQLFFLLLATARQALHAATEGCDRTGPLLLLRHGVGDGEATAILDLRAARRLGGRQDDLGGQTGTADDPLLLFGLVDTARAGGGGGRG